MDLRDEGIYLQLLRDTAQAAASSGAAAEALDAMVGLAARRLHLDVCSIYLADPAGALVLRATHGLRKESIGQVRMLPGEGLTGLVFETERSLFLARADEHPRFKYFPETGEERFRSFGGVPLLRRGRCIGVLTVQRAGEQAFHANEVVTLETLAQQVVGLIGVTRRLPDERPARGGAPAPAGRGRAVLGGLGTSPGVGIGRALLLDADVASLPAARPFAGEAEEWARFLAARERATAELDELAARLEREQGAAAGAIFRAQLELLLDGQIEARIRAQVRAGQPVERAVHLALEECAALLRQVPIPHVREKAVDLLDVRAQLLAALGAGEGAPVDGAGVVLVADLLTPAQTARLDPARVVAVVTHHGSETSHASILARSLGIPAVVGVPDLQARVAPGDLLLVDGENGFVIAEPDEPTRAEYAARAEALRGAEVRLGHELARLRSAGRRLPGVELWANVAFPQELIEARRQGAAGVGLLRTELFFLQRDSWPTRDEQVELYRRTFEAAPRGPVVARLLDAGGDKELPYLELPLEPNPILGLRSVRLLLAHPEVARTQLQALLEAARLTATDLRVLVPLVTAAWEVRAVRELLVEAAARLGVSPPPLGMMVETPSVLYQLNELAPQVDFLSVGTNDLTQYLLAVDRDNELVRQYYSPYHPAVLRALGGLVEGVAASGRPLTVCGEMAGDPLGALALLSLGYRRLSVRPRALPVLEALVHALADEDLAPLRAALLAAGTPTDVERSLRHAARAVAPWLLDAGPAGP